MDKDELIIALVVVLALAAFVLGLKLGGALDNIPSEGVIFEVQTTGDGTIIKVEYPDAIYRWFVGSDTCKIGQIVKLK